MSRRIRHALALVAVMTGSAFSPGVRLRGVAFGRDEVTFSRDVAPIVFDRCVMCHHEGGSAPFSLDSYAAVRRHATQIATVTRSRFMPPWKAEPGYGGDFVGQHPLTSDEIATIERWVDQGAAAGDPRDLPAPPRWTEGWQLGQPDLVVTLSEAYTLPPVGEKSYTVADSYVLPVDVDVLAVQPHAHYRARDVRGMATLPDGTERGLIHIRDWDFRWQHVYRFVTPLALPRGTTIAMRYTYDNSAENARNPQQPPKRVRWGQRSSDEMGDLWLQVLTRDDRDLTTLVGGFQPKMLAEDVIGYETMIRADPADGDLHDDVALLYLQLRRAEEAVAHFTASVKLKPLSAAAHFNLGTAQTRAGRLEEAAAEYRLALRIKPDYAAAHNNLGSVLSSQGRLDEAIQQYREALADDPGYLAAHNNLGSALVSRGDPGEALPHFLEALRVSPEYRDADYNIGHAYVLRGERATAIEHFRQVVRLDPDWAPGLSELTWLLATAPENALHDAGQAVRLAEHAADMTGKRDAKVLDVLAAAYADAGSFERALATAGAAVELRPADPLAADIRHRQALYRARQAYRTP